VIVINNLAQESFSRAADWKGLILKQRLNPFHIYSYCLKIKKELLPCTYAPNIMRLSCFDDVAREKINRVYASIALPSV
jgi:hypothetical protein